MFTITTPTIGTDAGKVTAAQTTLADVGAMTNCKGLWSVHDSATVSGSDITDLTDMSGSANDMTQSLAGRYPQIATDAATGLNVARFGTDHKAFMIADNAFDPRAAFSLFAVAKAKISDLTLANQSAIGGYGASAPDRAFINFTSNGKVQAFLGDDGETSVPFPGHDYDDEHWVFALMTYDGSGAASDANKMRLNGGAWAGGKVATEPSGTLTCWLGYSASGGATFVGDIAMAGIFDVDLSGAANESKLQLLTDAIKWRMRSALPPLPLPN